MVNDKLCSLCKNNSILKDSHIIPKFVGDWIKETSVTGKMRSAETPNKRVQDLVKTKLLCNDCEQLFSTYEKYFSENIFKPFLNSNNPIITYDVRLKKFVVSILWRILIYGFPRIIWKVDRHKHAANQVESKWRDYLYKDIKLIDDHSYLLMLKLVTDAKMIEGTNLDINWYFFRSVDGTIAQNNEDAFVYVKIPGFAFFSSINTHPLKHLVNSILMNRMSISQYLNFYMKDLE